ncbi:MAG: hypothetical protein QOI80_3439 [Solirubrobacteraceae bacterium]|nr:hypothetical protein [Solirubrobacteraceae bacterium]
MPPTEDESFIAAWDGSGTLHRALRDDVEFRFVSVRPAGAGELPFPVRSGVYEVVLEDGAVDAPGGAILINLFEVPEAQDDAFLAAWGRIRDAFADQPGCLGTRLHRARGPAAFRWVNVARWSSPLMFHRALQRADVSERLAAMPFPGHPALYLPVRS